MRPEQPCPKKAGPLGAGETSTSQLATRPSHISPQPQCPHLSTGARIPQTLSQKQTSKPLLSSLSSLTHCHVLGARATWPGLWGTCPAESSPLPWDSVTKTRPVCRWGNQGLRAEATCLPCSVHKWQGWAAELTGLSPERALPTDLSHGGWQWTCVYCVLANGHSPPSSLQATLLSCSGAEGEQQAWPLSPASPLQFQTDCQSRTRCALVNRPGGHFLALPGGPPSQHPISVSPEARAHCTEGELRPRAGLVCRGDTVGRPVHLIFLCSWLRPRWTQHPARQTACVRDSNHKAQPRDVLPLTL